MQTLDRSQLANNVRRSSQAQEVAHGFPGASGGLPRHPVPTTNEKKNHRNLISGPDRHNLPNWLRRGSSPDTVQQPQTIGKYGVPGLRRTAGRGLGPEYKLVEMWAHRPPPRGRPRPGARPGPEISRWPSNFSTRWVGVISTPILHYRSSA